MLPPRLGALLEPPTHPPLLPPCAPSAQALLVLVSCATKYPGLNMILQDMLVPLMPFSRDAAGRFRPPLHWVSHALRLVLFGEWVGVAGRP